MLILIILTIFLVFYFTFNMVNKYSEIVYVKSDYDNHTYIIRRGNSKSDKYLKDSANTLSEINRRILKLIEHLENAYGNDNSKNYFIKMLRKNYNPQILSEAAIDSRYTTYTVDKQNMHICLRTRDQSEELYDINLLMYVILHELAHLCNYNRAGYPIQGHGPEFKEIFKLLVIESIKINVYQYNNYVEKPQEYCGIVINSTIVNEDNLKHYM